MVGRRNAVHPEVRGDAVDAKLREDVVAEIPIELIFLRKMADVFHEGSPFTLAALATQLRFPLRAWTASF
jgi:hypothetical protein